MTTYQDPPLSRRAARQGERPESSTPYPAQNPLAVPGSGEPLDYVTQNRPPLPGYDAQPAAGRRAAEPAQPAAEAPQPATEGGSGEQPAFRPRDYSPEARTAPPAWAPEYDRGGVVEYQTQTRATVAPAAASLAESLAGAPNEQTLTRRELRLLREQNRTADTSEVAPLDQSAAPAPAAPVAPVTPVSFPQAPVAPQLFSAPAVEADEATAAPQRRGGRRAAQPSPVDEPTTGFLPRIETAAVPEQPAPEQPAPPAFEPRFSPEPVAPEQPAPPVFEPRFSPEPVSTEAVAPEPVAPVMPEPEAPAQAAPVVPAPLVEPAAPAAPVSAERPAGHWTTQADLDDATQVNESTISRRIGAGSLTTSALVLPSLPGQDMTTGETMLTGSINLPSSLSSTGAHAPLDESDIDHLLDPGDHQLVNTDSVPIRAIKAVSSHTGSRQAIIGTVKPKNHTRALTALIAAASAMVVVVVTLLVVAIATDVL